MADSDWRLIPCSIHHQFYYLTISKALICIYMNWYTGCWCRNLWLTNPSLQWRNCIRRKQKRMKQRRDVFKGTHHQFCVKGAPVVMQAPSGAAVKIYLLHKNRCWTIDRYLLHFSIIPSHCVFFISVCVPGESRGSNRQHALIRMVCFCSGLRSNGEPSIPLLDLRLSGAANRSSPLCLSSYSAP